ncbi:MAG: flagellar motor stator protein MotA [Myxococcales bacterium]|nr:flagellar motor stator protein MotA [Myxococcales bacterium]
MQIVFGLVFVVICVIGGYLFAHGNLAVLYQPAELIIIGGAALGSLFISTPRSTIKQMGKAIAGGIKRKSSAPQYLNLLKVLFDLATLVRKEGILALENHVENTDSSPILSNLSKHKDLLDYMCDSLRLVLIGIEFEELSGMLEVDLETREEEAEEPGTALSTVADALPGLGIVAAVLGIIITMGSIGGDTAEVGKHVAAALVGTFLGVLLSYGFVGPLAHVVKSEMMHGLVLMRIAKIGIIGLSMGANPLMVCESARRAIPETDRPTFKLMEDTVRGK